VVKSGPVAPARARWFLADLHIVEAQGPIRRSKELCGLPWAQLDAMREAVQEETLHAPPEAV
jgi:hypothetical protein